MRALLFATTAIAALAGQAMAADMPVKARPVIAVPGCAQFGGFFFGAHAGFGYYDHTWRDRDSWAGGIEDDLVRSSLDLNESGFIGGIQGGWNWQQGCTVFGLQADYSFASINTHAFETDGELPVETLTVDSKLKGFGTVRLRTGIVVDNLLLYATGGIGFGSFDRSYTLDGEFRPDLNSDPLLYTETFSTDKTKWAWVAGLGTEWAVWNGWSIQSEVLYARFENDEATFICGGALCSEDNFRSRPKRFEHQDTVWIAKIGVNYRWGGAPAAIRY